MYAGNARRLDNGWTVTLGPCPPHPPTCRTPFCPTEAFHYTALAPDRFFTEACASRLPSGEVDPTSRVWLVLKYAPSLIPFQVHGWSTGVLCAEGLAWEQCLRYAGCWRGLMD